MKTSKYIITIKSNSYTETDDLINQMIEILSEGLTEAITIDIRSYKK